MDRFEGQVVLLGNLLWRQRLGADCLAIKNLGSYAAIHSQLPVRRASLRLQVFVHGLGHGISFSGIQALTKSA
jgi:hypothetical protein